MKAVIVFRKKWNMYFLYCFILNNIKQKHKSSYRWHTVRDELVMDLEVEIFLWLYITIYVLAEVNKS